jgi:hypothetical protein
VNHDSQGQRRFALYTIWGTLRIMVRKVSWCGLYTILGNPGLTVSPGSDAHYSPRK